jgi:hypothetical protein
MGETIFIHVSIRKIFLRTTKPEHLKLWSRGLGGAMIGKTILHVFGEENIEEFHNIC